MTELAVCDIITESFANETVILFRMYAVICVKGNRFYKGCGSFEFLITSQYKLDVK